MAIGDLPNPDELQEVTNLAIWLLTMINYDSTIINYDSTMINYDSLYQLLLTTTQVTSRRAHGRKPHPARLPTLSFFCLECFSLGLFRLRVRKREVSTGRWSHLI